MAVIEARDLEKSFDGRQVLSGISFSVGRGEVFGLLGPNGAGKTTTMRLLLGLMKPSRGEALVFGVPLREDDAARRRAGVLLEHSGMSGRLTARENMVYFAKLYGVPAPKDRADELLAFVGLSDRANDRVGTFSTGMQRKIGLARAILHDPEVLFLDEPTSGLDPAAQAMVRDLLIALSEKESMTVLVNSHNLDEVERVCSSVAILDRGRLLAYDTIEHLRHQTGPRQYRFILTDPGQADLAVSALASAGVSTYEREGAVLTVSLPPDVRPPALIRALVESGIGLEEAAALSRSLEEIYLATTGGETA
jgi:ABC-2 type transport system ATP-binding protein